MRMYITATCADLDDAKTVLNALGSRIVDFNIGSDRNSDVQAVVETPAPATVSTPAPTGSKGIPVPAKATRTPKAVKTPAPAAVEEVDPVEDVGAVEATAENIEADYKKSLTDARALLVGKGVGTKEKALVMAIKSQCLALTGSEDTNAVVNPDDMSALTALINAEIAKYKGA